MDEIKQLIDQIDNEKQWTGDEVKKILNEVIEFAEFELELKQRAHDLYVKAVRLKVKRKEE